MTCLVSLLSCLAFAPQPVPVAALSPCRDGARVSIGSTALARVGQCFTAPFEQVPLAGPAPDSRPARRNDLWQILAFIRRRWPIVLICVVVCPLAAFLASILQTDQYEAKASLLFREPGFNQNIFESQRDEPRSPITDRDAATNVRLTSLRVVRDRTAEALRRKGVTGVDVENALETRAEGNSDLVTITATHRDPRVAADVANTFAREFIAFRREADRASIAEGQQLLAELLARLNADERDSARGRKLEQRAADLSLIASLQTGNAELVQPATVPSAPASPRPVRNAALGLLFGLLAGLGLALALDRLDRRLRTPEEIEQIYERPMLGGIPASRSLRDARQALDGLPPLEAEAFQLLRANLRYFNTTAKRRSVLVTSAEAGDGKSTVALNLALAAVRAGSRVLLLEADLRRPKLAESLELDRRRGLSNILAGAASLDDSIQSEALRAAGDAERELSLDIVASGPLPPNPVDLMESGAMHDTLALAEERYELVVVDVPPLTVVSDAIPLIKQVGGVVVVARPGKTNRDPSIRLRDQLRHLDAPVLGLVMNHLPAGGRYGYGYGYEPASEPVGIA